MDNQPVNDPSDSLSSINIKQKSLMGVLTRFAEKTSMQGVPYINMSKFWWARALWSICLLVAMGVLGLHMWFLLSQYLQWPTVTKVSFAFANLAFPAVTLCNTNIMHSARFLSFVNDDNDSGIRRLIKDLDPRGYSNQVITPGVPLADNWNVVNFTSIKSDYNATYSDGELPKTPSAQIEDLLTEMLMDIPRADRAGLGHNISDMLLSCSFNGRKCNSSLFKLHQTSEFGNCWTLESDDLMAQNAGERAGLSMMLYTETTQYLPAVSHGYGMRIQIHDHGSIPFPDEEGIFVPVAMESSIGLKYVQMKREGEPYTTCDNGDKFTHKYGRKFTRRTCWEMCKVQHTYNMCNCIPNTAEEIAMSHPDIKNVTFCRGNTGKRCLSSMERQFDQKEIDCNCNNPCHEVRFERSISNRVWPSGTFSPILAEGLCRSGYTEMCDSRPDPRRKAVNIEENFLKLNIFFEELNYELYEEVPEIENQQFLSDVGGAIGLWIGLSILSLCEVIQLLMELCHLAIYKTARWKSLNNHALSHPEKQWREKF